MNEIKNKAKEIIANAISDMYCNNAKTVTTSLSGAGAKTEKSLITWKCQMTYVWNVTVLWKRLHLS